GGQRFPSLLTVVVVCGYLASVGNDLSTLSAHPGGPVPALSPRARALCRREEDPAPSGTVAASYARYSSDQQDGSSIDQQRRKCREAAAGNGHDLGPALEFADHAVSGTRVDRGGFQAMLAAARDGRFGVLYVESLSRLARELVISMPVLKELVYVHKVRVISTSEGIDSDRAGWEFMAVVRGWMHGEFLTALRSAVLRGQEEAVLGDYSVGDWCFGYASEPVPGSESGRRGRNAKPRMRVVVREDHARWVRTIFRWFVEDRRSLGWIARELTRQKAPKDHRSTTPEWRQQYVVGVLENRKYIGIWPWGKRTNVRNPLTGKVRQEDRPPAEAAKYERERRHLRIVQDDATFFRAQALLDVNRERFAARRRRDGRLRGSTKDPGRPRHLLQGVVRCAACGSTFKVAGAGGKYLACDGYTTGACTVRTRLRRDRAERLILGAIGDRILRDPAWRAAVLESARAAWERGRAIRPDEAKDVEAALAAVGQKISRLVDAIEAGEAGPDVGERLAARRRERDELVRRRDALRRDGEGESGPPTAEWVDAQLGRLHEVLTGGTPAAGVALGNLIGTVVVAEATSGGRKRKYLRGTFTPRTAAALGEGGPSPEGEVVPGSACETVTLDFTDPPPWAGVADAVKEMYDAGVRFEDMAARLRCPRSWPAKALAHWYQERGSRPPDGRATCDRLAADPAVPELSDRAKEL
ncbi:MAG TPA: recombinase family protein, partial [Gemmataceae bacterium]|nr:recombinase family protein [Gemmataceae bacterium]